ncbi:MAG: hypothetical protein NTW26_11375 [bacterium]|nr:hypothetical protein [bacterium]
MSKMKSTHRIMFLAAVAALPLFLACESSDDEFAGMTPCAEVTYPDTVGIAPADEPLVSFYASLDPARPLILREENVSTYVVLPNCDTTEIGSPRAEVSYSEAEKEPYLRLTLDGLDGVVKLADLPRGESYCIKNVNLALQVVRVGSLEISGAVFARFPHCSVAIKTPNPANWIIEAALLPPEAMQPTGPSAGEGEAEANDFGTGTPELANLERFFLTLQGGVVNNTQLTIQGQYTGDQSVTSGQMFFSPAPATPAEAEQIKSSTVERIRDLYLNAPGWKVAERLTVEALGWNEPYFSSLVNWSGTEVDVRLTWSDPASSTVIYQAVDTIGLVRWTDFLWYVDVDHILRLDQPAGENRLWTGYQSPADVTSPGGTVLEEADAAEQPTDE